MAEYRQKIVSCPKGLHFYDANRYQSCPFCSNSFAATTDPFSEPGNSASGGAYAGQGSFSATVDPGVYGGKNDYGNGGWNGGAGMAQGGAGGFVPTAPPEYGAGDEGNFGVTTPPRVISGPAGGPSSMSKTTFVDDFTPEGEPLPVVGWLVAIEGPCRGTDYRLHTGYNNIGRERGDVCIRGDNAISAEKDASVTYVYQTSKFYIAHEQGKNVLLVNDLPVVGGSMELKNYDRITIGTTKLLFLGLCGENFRWNEKG